MHHEELGKITILSIAPQHRAGTHKLPVRPRHFTQKTGPPIILCSHGSNNKIHSHSLDSSNKQALACFLFVRSFVHRQRNMSTSTAASAAAKINTQMRMTCPELFSQYARYPLKGRESWLLPDQMSPDEEPGYLAGPNTGLKRHYV